MAVKLNNVKSLHTHTHTPVASSLCHSYAFHLCVSSISCLAQPRKHTSVRNTLLEGISSGSQRAIQISQQTLLSLPSFQVARLQCVMIYPKPFTGELSKLIYLAFERPFREMKVISSSAFVTVHVRAQTYYNYIIEIPIFFPVEIITQSSLAPLLS